MKKQDKPCDVLPVAAYLLISGTVKNHKRPELELTMYLNTRTLVFLVLT